jgi:flagellar hook-length control protein FliK
MNQNNRKQVVLKLNPEHLGKLEINISMIKKSTKVEIKVQKHETLELLSHNQTSLKNLFSEIKKTSNEISFSFDKNTNSESNTHDDKKKQKKHQKIQEKFNYSENETMNSYVGLIEIIVLEVIWLFKE